MPSPLMQVSGWKSETRNKKGEGITSQDGALTKEEWKEFTRWAEEKGVQVVPEIDTPAHSLAITRVFPEYALADEPDNVDHLDLSKKRDFGAGTEYLEGIPGRRRSCFSPKKASFISAWMNIMAAGRISAGLP